MIPVEPYKSPTDKKTYDLECWYTKSDCTENFPSYSARLLSLQNNVLIYAKALRD